MRRLWIGAIMAMTLAACGPARQTQLTGHWDVQMIDGAPLREGVRAWIEIDHPTGEVSGFTGCRNFTTTISSFDTSVAFARVREGTGQCSSETAASEEIRFLGALRLVQRFVRRNRSLELMPATAGGEALLKLSYEEARSL